MKISRCVRCLLLAALAAGLRAEDKPAGEPAKSAGWLVDAMNDQTAGSQDDSKSGAVQGEAGSRTKTPLPGTRTEDGAVNPLSSYLKTWMTPRDLEILKIKSSDANAPGTTTWAAPAPLAAGGLTPNLRANPYLPDPTQGDTGRAKGPQNPPAPTPPPTALPEVKNDVAPAKTPGPPAGVLKSEEDAKYFPQLKHF